MSSLKPHFSLFDKSFAFNKSKQYKIYIELSNNSLKQTVFDTENNTFIGLEAYQLSDIYNDYSLVTPLKEIVSNNPIYKNEFKGVYISIVNNRSTLIPNAIYKADKLASFHQFNFTKQEEDLFFSDQLINLAANNIFSIPDFITPIFSSLKNVHFTHFSSALIEASLLTTTKLNCIAL